MKIRPTRDHAGVVVELGPTETQLPGESNRCVLSIKRILVPTDFSECSAKAISYAVGFARQFDAEIIVAHVAEPYIPVPELMPVDADLLLSRMRNDAEKELARVRESIPADVRCRTALRVGRCAQEVINAADELDADLILLSTHGRTGFGRVLLGSVAEHVTRHAHCPVLIVRDREREFVETSEKN